MHKAVKLLSSIGLCLAIGALGSIFTSSSVNNWYESILKPSFNPPNWLFGPVWTILFILMGITLYLLLIAKKSKNRTLTLKLFYAQLGFNLLWSIFFFGWKNPLLALIDLIILWIFILFTLLKTFKVSRRGGYLLIPYLVWVSFAFVLNLSIVLLN